MTPEQAREAAAVMLAWADGKKIQRKRRIDCVKWEEVKNPAWQWEVAEYRVAPEPWQGKIWVHPDGSIGAFDPDVDDECWAKHGWRLITAKEVADE